MARRAVLIGLMLVLAGCLTQAGAPTATVSPTDTPVPTQDSPTPTVSSEHTASTPESWRTPPFPEWNPPEEPYRQLVFGNRTEEGPEPHGYTIWNHDDEPRTIAIRIVRNGTEIHARRHEFPARATLEITFNAPANYTITVSVVGSNRSRTFTDPVGSFDCNRKWSNVAVLEAGAIRVDSYQTKVGCP